jgi:hypothetical protein
MEEMVTISKREYDALVANQDELNALQVFGVDNWSGYQSAMRYLNDEEEEW